MTWVLFFDGDCAFCHASVRRVARWDKRGRVCFAPLQGETARKLGLAGHAAQSGGTMVLQRESDGVLFTRGDAVLELSRVLGGPWRLVAFIPRRWRNAVYQFIADRRHLVRRGRACELPDAALAARLRD